MNNDEDDEDDADNRGTASSSVKPSNTSSTSLDSDGSEKSKNLTNSNGHLPTLHSTGSSNSLISRDALILVPDAEFNKVNEDDRGNNSTTANDNLTAEDRNGKEVN